MTTVTIHTRIANVLSTAECKRARDLRALGNRRATLLELRDAKPSVVLPASIIVTRIESVALKPNAFAASIRPVQEGIADYLKTTWDDPRIKWDLRQLAVMGYAVEITFPGATQ